MTGSALGQRPLCVAYGNCQVDDIRHVLSRLEPFAARFDVFELAPVQEMTLADAERLREAISEADLLIVQPIGDEYRGLQIGSESLIAQSPRKVIRIPSMFYRGLFPFQIHIGNEGEEHVNAPVVEYHDARMLHCAARGYDYAEALRWWRRYEPDPATLRTLATESLDELRARERAAGVDVGVAELLDDRTLLAQSFNTINHPTRRVIDRVVDGVLECAGLAEMRAASYSGHEGIPNLRAPIEGVVADALGVEPSAEQDWAFGDERWPLHELLRVHLAFYRDHPDVVALGMRRNAELLDRLALDRVDGGPQRVSPPRIKRSRWSPRTRPARLLWIINHQTLVDAEVPILRELGYEVFTPKLVPDDAAFRSSSITDEFDESMTIDADSLARLGSHDFYSGRWDRELADLIDREFDVAVVGLNGYITPFSEAARKFGGLVIGRAFGREHPARYTTFFDEGEPPLLEVVAALGERFVFGRAYAALSEIEAPQLAGRSRTISLPPPGHAFDGVGEWDGSGDRAVFLCPGIRDTIYYGAIYDRIKADFGDVPHVIFGRQVTPVDDSAVLPYLSDDGLVDLYRHAPVFVYPSVEPRHVHYSPIEAMVVGAPVLYYAGTLTDRIAGRRDLPGRCASTDEMRAKARALLAGDRELADAIRAPQLSIVDAFDVDAAREEWRDVLSCVPVR